MTLWLHRWADVNIISHHHLHEIYREPHLCEVRNVHPLFLCAVSLSPQSLQPQSVQHQACCHSLTSHFGRFRSAHKSASRLMTKSETGLLTCCGCLGLKHFYQPWQMLRQITAITRLTKKRHLNGRQPQIEELCRVNSKLLLCVWMCVRATPPFWESQNWHHTHLCVSSRWSTNDVLEDKTHQSVGKLFYTQVINREKYN